VVLPSAAWVEREGTWTNVAGRVQRFWRAVGPLGEARPDWEILTAVARALGQDWPPQRGASVFRDLAAAVPAFGGMTYGTLGDAGASAASRAEGRPIDARGAGGAP
jgi:predicted molibdopterin-dependent oxidoreductase YjgC